MTLPPDTRTPAETSIGSTAPEEPTRPVGLGVIGWLRWGWRTLTTMRTALILLFLFALGSVPGSIFPQRGVDPDKVAQYFQNSPTEAEWLDRFKLFDVFTSPWYAAIYLLLFISLAGCVLPRAFTHVKEIRRKPPAAPRNLTRLPYGEAFEGDLTVEEAAARLRRKRFRVVTGPDWVAAEKGYLRETGNLFFHLALLGLLFAVGAGGLYGYRGNVLVVEGDGFANTVAAYDRFMPGQRVTAESLAPFSFTLKDFHATYVDSGEKLGQPLDYGAKLSVKDTPSSPPRDVELKVNDPLDVNGTLTYLIGHGYAPVVKVTDGKGQVAYEGPVPCLVDDQATYTSECTIKVPDAQPAQLGISARFFPTTATDGKTWWSIYPGADNPSLQVYAAYKGDLGLNSGQPQSVYVLDATGMEPLLNMSEPPHAPLLVGGTFELPGGAGKVQFTGVKEWITIQVTRDPGRIPALVAAAVAVIGLVLSLMVRRRRVWVRVTGRKVAVGGLTRTEGDGSAFSEEFAGLVALLRDSQDSPDSPDSQAPPAPQAGDRAAASPTEPGTGPDEE
ncbi:cytochrome c biosynthesis protein [Planotetraspora thailandica]|uniref:Cytochrome c biosynthesis protein n=1 Tax=Planotetraspora thailandica TaxID=487172 RepID=A0A8J3VB45_9ACTN|nr:cytochrome c biogenesis protein ResB [Planotetraspora thailandica]GII53625.1 cytochrome c biosynthesis protein [Planotetraspora thailandica]